MTAPANPERVLAINDLNVWFNTGRGAAQTTSHVVRGVTLNLAPGDRLGLVGESGSGKTTTILAAMGLLPSSAEVAGQILLNDRDILRGGEQTVAPHRWKDISMVFQGAMSALNPVRTIGWQIAEAMQIHGIAKGEDARHRVAGLLDLVGIRQTGASQYPHQMSGGMRQRAMIAMALACEPRVLLADEPTTALDVIVQRQILQLLVDLSERLNLALILVTHDLGVVAQTCQHGAVMLDGEVVEQGPVSDLYRQPRHPYTRRLFEAAPDIRAAATRPRAAADTDPRQLKADRLLSVNGLTVSYLRSRTFKDYFRGRHQDALIAVNDFSLTVARGEMVALVGGSGSGKTTALQAILGMVRPVRGSILLNGRDVSTLGHRQWRPLRRQVQMIYQDPYEALDLRFRGRSTLEEPLWAHGIRTSAKEREALVAEALDRVELSPADQYLNRFPHELSGGQRQRVAIAASLVLRPHLLLADEPVSMLDVSVRNGVLQLLDRLRSGSEMGILMVTHDLSTAAAYADRIVVMNKGRIVEQGGIAEVVTRPRDAYTKALLASIPDPDPEAGKGDPAG